MLQSGTGVEGELSNQEIEQAILEDLQAGVPEAETLVKEAADWAADAADDLARNLSIEGDEAVVGQEFIEAVSVPDSVLSDLQTEDSELKLDQELVTSASDKEQVEKEGELFNGPSYEEVLEPESPEKDSITTRLDDWWVGIKNLPIVSLLTGTAVELSGASCVVNIPNPFNGENMVVSLCEYEDVLTAVGNIMLGTMTVGMVIWLFM
jgi:hypothetical protein